MLNNFIALTIGPITSTLSKARRVKEFWFVSFLFSQIMNRITKQVFDSHTDKSDIVLPYIEQEKDFEMKKVGIFPDWLIFKSQEGDYGLIKTYITNSIETLAEDLEVGEIKKGVIIKFLTDYLKIYYFEQNNVTGNPILTLSPTLHQIELQNPIYETDTTGLLYQLFKLLYKTKFYSKHYRDNADDRHESIEEIATRDLKTKLIDGENAYKKLLRETSFKKEENEDTNSGNIKEDLEFFPKLITAVKQYDKIKNNEISSFKSFHKYIAIVKADGDKIGTTLASISEGKEGAFSEKLFKWGIEAKKLIIDYEGLPLYVGGDDMLFFAPIVNGSINILELIENINKVFENQFIDYEVKPTLSFGVSITYYKYPLFEAMENADELLYLAKKQGGNGIFTQLLKHSGASFKLFIDLKEDNLFKTIVDKLVAADTKSSVISAVSYYLRDNEKVFETIGFKVDRIDAFFKNNIEGYKNSDYLKNVNSLVQERFEKKSNELLPAIYKETMTEIYDTLRFTKFIKGFDENDR